MTHRRHSFCQLDLPSVVDSLDSFFGGRQAVDEFTVCRSRSSNAIIMSSLGSMQTDGAADRRKAVKSKNKKKKKGKNKNTVETSDPPPYSSAENTEVGPSEPAIGQTNMKAPMIVNGASWNGGVHRSDQTQYLNIISHEMGGSSNMFAETISSPAPQSSQANPGSVSRAFESLQNTMRATAPRELSYSPLPNPSGYNVQPKNESHGTQGLAVTVQAPSVATEGTVRASSVQSDVARFPDAHHGQSLPLLCEVHGRSICQFNRSCCFHRPKDCLVCPQKSSCCCIHHAGDCCFCLAPRPYGFPDSRPQFPMPAGPPQSGPAGTGTMHTDGAPDMSKQRPEQFAASTAEMNTAGQENGEHLRSEHSAIVTSPDVPQVNSPQSAPIQNQASHVATPIQVTPISEKNAEALTAYILNLFESEQFCDLRVVLKSSKNLFQPITFRAHKALMARCPFITSVLKSANDGHAEITAVAGENFFMIKAFTTAIQTLYGLPILDYEQLRKATVLALGYTEENFERCPLSINTPMADFALCYAASGAFFQQPEIVETGIKLVVGLIDWNNLEMILYFGHRASNFSVISPVKDSNQASVTELQEEWAPLVVTAAFEFIACHFKPDFEFYAQAQAKNVPDRIPVQLRAVPSSAASNPNLAKVKFGSLESFEEQKPSREIELISAIFIYVPFETLKKAFEVLGAQQILTMPLAQAIVQEREARRHRALLMYQTLGGSYDEDKIPDEVWPLGYQEFLAIRVNLSESNELTAPMDFSLERGWMGTRC